MTTQDQSKPKIGDLSKQNIRDQVYRYLRDRMHNGEITHADRLVDHELAASMGVSRMPVREALLQLKSEGYLEGTSRGFVLPQFSPADISYIFEIRILLEPSAAAEACGRSTMEGLGKLKVATESATRAHMSGDVLAYMHANWEFRDAWMVMVPNPYLVKMISRLHDQAQAVRLTTLKDEEYRGKSLEHTQRILEAFLAKDSDAVRERVTHNLRVAAASYYAKQKALIQEEGKTTSVDLEGSDTANRQKR